MKLIAVITFGHQASDIAHVLEGAVRASRERGDVRVVVLDDASGSEPAELPGIEILVTPKRGGFSAAVNYLVQTVAPGCERLILLNPDISLKDSALTYLLDSANEVSILPIVDDAGYVENLRPVLTCRTILMSLFYRDNIASRRLYRISDVRAGTLCPPAAPAGTVISIDANLIRDFPFRPEMFWIEFSDWVRQLAAARQPVRVELGTEPVDHVGASTAVNYPISVAASQLHARYAFVCRYGTLRQRLLLRPALAVKAGRVAVQRKEPSLALFLWRAAVGRTDWRVSS